MSHQWGKHTEKLVSLCILRLCTHITHILYIIEVIREYARSRLIFLTFVVNNQGQKLFWNVPDGP